MTANQLSFAKLQEEKRHNLVTEEESIRHNVADEAIRGEANTISKYSAQVTQEHYIRNDAINEEHYGRMDAETVRSHMAGEEISKAELKEKTRSNKAQEKIAKTQAEAAMMSAEASKSQAKTAKKNATSNRMTAEANVKNAETNAINAQTNARNAATNAKNAQTNAYNAQTNRYAVSKDAAYKNASVIQRGDELKETERHNKEQELLTHNANQIKFLTTPSADIAARKTQAEIDRDRAQATASLAQAGYLKTQADWYAWRTISQSAVDISQATRNFINAGTAVITLGLGD